MKNPRRIGNLVMVLSALTLTGCGQGGADDQPDLGRVSGTVFFEGEVLPGASISFIPEEGRPATGKTDEQGMYELVYIRDTRGCKVGQNKVVITTVGEGEDLEELDGDDLDQSQLQRVVEKVPAKYNANSELIAIVNPGENTFDFRLEK
ncbi:carboxypeptidase regulatory-like domain-containing protein [Thalassoglobus sp.]|uniref:carboxypeptidase regulatory-like domain-containing protein n=1 Tax=Thalassoglobus sp. TaxID=2795869 RepID=UPI003AA948DF